MKKNPFKKNTDFINIDDPTIIFDEKRLSALSTLHGEDTIKLCVPQLIPIYLWGWDESIEKDTVKPYMWDRVNIQVWSDGTELGIISWDFFAGDTPSTFHSGDRQSISLNMETLVNYKLAGLDNRRKHLITGLADVIETINRLEQFLLTPDNQSSDDI